MTSQSPLPAYFTPGPYDVLIGRGNKFSCHPGNVMFRQYASQYAIEYSMATTKSAKSNIITVVVEAVRDKGGKFVKLEDNKTWLVAEDFLCREKCAGIFRETLRASDNNDSSAQQRQSSPSSQKKRKRASGNHDGNNFKPRDSTTIVEETFYLCHVGHWKEILERLKKHPDLGVTVYRGRTILTHAIRCTDPASSALRTQIILLILQQTPKAASITNTRGGTPLHAMCNRSVRFLPESNKDLLRIALIKAYPAGILIRSKQEGKTPLHILMGADPSQEIMEFMLQKQFNGQRATYMKDVKGRLPIHEAVRNNLKKAKLYQMELLLQANPCSIAVKDLEGKTVLDLVQDKSSSPSSFHNKKLILSLVEMIEL